MDWLKAKIHYTSFSVTSPQQVRNINDKSVTSWRRYKSVSLGNDTTQLTDTTDFCNLWRTCYGETGVIDFGL